jgi:hypothetical protein
MARARPIYETRTDQLNESLVMCEFLCMMNEASGRQYRAEKIPMTDGHSPDYRVVQEGSDIVVAYTEVKRRHYTSQQIEDMGGVFLSAAKYRVLENLALNGYRTAFVVAFDDVWGYYVITECDVVAGTGGRVDRNDPMDVENLVRFLPDQMKVFYQPER